MSILTFTSLSCLLALYIPVLRILLPFTHKPTMRTTTTQDIDLPPLSSRETARDAAGRGLAMDDSRITTPRNIVLSQIQRASRLVHTAESVLHPVIENDRPMAPPGRPQYEVMYYLRSATAAGTSPSSSHRAKAESVAAK